MALRLNRFNHTGRKLWRRKYEGSRLRADGDENRSPRDRLKGVQRTRRMIGIQVGYLRSSLDARESPGRVKMDVNNRRLYFVMVVVSVMTHGDMHVLVRRRTERHQQGNTKREDDNATHQHAIIHE
jgi:hypothetical protein